MNHEECKKKCLEECIGNSLKDAKPVWDTLEYFRGFTISIACETYCEKKCRG